MAEKLNAFIALYNKKAEEQLAKATTRLEEFKKLRAEGIAFKDTINMRVDDITFSTLGEFIAALYPEKGGVDRFLFQKLLPSIISNFDKDSTEDKNKRKVIDDLLDRKGAPMQYKHAVAVKEQSGEKFFGGVRSATISIIARAQSRNSTITYDYLFGTNSKDPKEKLIKNFYSIITHSPDRDVYEFLDEYGILHNIKDVLDSEELFDAIVEAGPPPTESKPSASPINQATGAEPAKETSASPINQSEAGAKPETSAPSPAITATETTTKAAEPESKVVTTPEVINQPKAETPPAETVKEKAPAAGETVQAKEKAAQTEVINIGEKEIREIEKTKEQEKKIETNVANITSKLNITDESKKSAVTDILTKFAKSKSPGESPTVSGQGQAGFLGEFAKSQQLAESFKGAPTPTASAINVAPKVATTEFTNIQSSALTNTSNLQTSSVETGETTVGGSTSVINAPKTLTQEQQNIINKFKESKGILSPEEKAKRQMLEQSIKVETGTGGALPKAESAVDKGRIEFGEKITANTQNNFSSTQMPQPVAQTVVNQEKTQPVAVSAKPVEVPSSPTASGTPAGPQTAMTDMSGVEKRLRNLEEILSSPLRVVIS